MKWLTRMVFVAVAAVCIPNARAADSKWLLCDDGSLAVNSLEHRAADGASRETGLKLMLGDHLVMGALKNVDSGKVRMKSPTVESDSFVGTIAIDYAKNKMTVKGKLTLNGTAFDLNAALACKELQSKL
jgi:hypothetical protein